MSAQIHTNKFSAVIAVLAGLIVLVGCVQQKPSQPVPDTTVPTAAAPTAAVNVNTNGPVAATTTADTFTGTLLAGSTAAAPLYDFNKADYDKAIAQKRNILLYFYANWCPECKIEIPILYETFNHLSKNDYNFVVGFRVNFNDSDTDSDEVALARELGVAYQHTKVLVKNGQRVLKSPETWDAARYLKEIATYFSNGF